MANTFQNDQTYRLKQQYGIQSWQNSLSIPNPEFTYSKHQLDLQQEVNFVFLPDLDEKADRFLGFVSDQTNFNHLFEILPFLLEDLKLYFCEDHLIKERLASIGHWDSFSTDNKATRQLNSLIETAVQKNASDIHIESHPYNKVIRLRVNGKLTPFHMDDLLENALFSKIKLVSKMDISKTLSPQDGHFSFTSETGKQFDMRTSTVPSVFGEKIVIRLLPSTTVKFSMEKLGFSEDCIPIIQKHIQRKAGMILFTGPTGSGKTTSLYAILNELNAQTLNIMTIEDPVEYRLNGVNQVEVNEKAGRSFSATLRAFLRQDPDVILVGEIRDQETAKIAARASQTGHLVLSTLHSNNVFETIRRLNNLGVDHEDLASSLRLIISQRLVRRQCRCELDPNCIQCGGSGITGRIPVMEVLEVKKELREQIAQGAQLKSLTHSANQLGFIPLREAGLQMVENGSISLNELNSICNE